MILKKEGSLIMVRMIDGEDFFSNLENVTKKFKLKSGIILNGVGQLKEVELGYYSKEKKKYYMKKFKGPFEVLSLSGNIGFFDGKVISHIHLTLGDKKFNCIGGHLNHALVNSTLELFILVTRTKFIRKFDETTGLKLLEFR